MRVTMSSVIILPWYVDSNFTLRVMKTLRHGIFDTFDWHVSL